MDLEYEEISSDEECFVSSCERHSSYVSTCLTDVVSSCPSSPESTVSTEVSEWERDIDEIELGEPDINLTLTSMISHLKKITDPIDIITPVKFIIGGTTFLSNYETLNKVPVESPLQRVQIIDGVHTTHLDRDPELFPYILKFIRNGRITSTSLPTDIMQLSDLLEEAIFFLLPVLADACGRKLLI